MPLLKTDFVYRAEPINLVRSENATLTAADGRTYIDLEAASGSAIFGYDRQLLIAAAGKAAALPSKPQFCESTARLDLTARLDRLFYAATGSEGLIAFDLGGAQGIELALKIISAQKPGAATIVTFDGCYHGRSLSLSKISSSSRYDHLAGHGPYRVIRLPVPSLLAHIRAISLQESLMLCLKRVEEIFTDERFGVIGGTSPLHSLVYEPILNAAGMYPLDSEYLAGVAKRVRSLGGTIVADEIFTGFFKTNRFLASACVRDCPDIIVVSKGLTNGLAPLSVVWVKEGITECVETPGLHSSTYINNEFALCAALSVMDRIDEANANSNGPNEAIHYLFSDHTEHEFVREVFVSHNVGAVRLATPLVAKRLTEALLANGLLTATTGLSKDSIILHPCLTISSQEVERARRSVDLAFSSVQIEGEVA
jgi:adenosylmethionine-8-amino-7-oxononanoate aminotransferase